MSYNFDGIEGIFGSLKSGTHAITTKLKLNLKSHHHLEKIQESTVLCIFLRQENSRFCKPCKSIRMLRNTQRKISNKASWKNEKSDDFYNKPTDYNVFFTWHMLVVGWGNCPAGQDGMHTPVEVDTCRHERHSIAVGPQQPSHSASHRLCGKAVKKE